MRIPNLKKRFLKPTSNSAFFIPTDAAVLLGVTFGSMALFIGLSVAIANVLQAHFLTVAISMPRLHVDELLQMNANGTLESCADASTTCILTSVDGPVLVMYNLLKETVFDRVILFTIFVIIIMFMLELAGFIKNMTKPYLMKIVVASLLVLALPFFWDYMAEGIEIGALWLLNPLYSVNPEDPCIKDLSNPLLANLAIQNEGIAKRLKGIGSAANDDPNYHCSPNLRVHYIFAKAFHGASYDAPQGADFFEGLGQLLGQLGANAVNTLWGGITKATMITFTTMYAIAMLVGSKVWMSSIITIFPLLVLLTFVPKIGVVPKKILEMLPGLIMIPIMVSAVIVGGSTGLYMMEQKITDGDPLFPIGAKGDAVAGPDDFIGTNLIFWMTAVTVLLIAATTPALLVPSLMSLSNTVGTAVGSAAVSGVVGASAIGKGAAQGGGQALSGSFAAAKAAPGSTAANFFSPATFKNVAGGLGGGGLSGSKAAMDADMQAGLGKHGAGDLFKSPGNSGISGGGGLGKGTGHVDRSDPDNPGVIDSGSTRKDKAYADVYGKSSERSDKKLAKEIHTEVETATKANKGSPQGATPKISKDSAEHAVNAVAKDVDGTKSKLDTLSGTHKADVIADVATLASSGKGSDNPEIHALLNNARVNSGLSPILPPSFVGPPPDQSVSHTPGSASATGSQTPAPPGNALPSGGAPPIGKVASAAKANVAVNNVAINHNVVTKSPF